MPAMSPSQTKRWFPFFAGAGLSRTFKKRKYAAALHADLGLVVFNPLNQRWADVPWVCLFALEARRLELLREPDALDPGSYRPIPDESAGPLAERLLAYAAEVDAHRAHRLPPTPAGEPYRPDPAVSPQGPLSAVFPV